MHAAGAPVSDTKKRILHLIQRYGAARAQEEVAGFRDQHATMKRNYDTGQARWAEIGAELDALIAVSDSPSPVTDAGLPCELGGEE